VFERLDCVCLHTTDMRKSLDFLTSMGMTEAWRLERVDDGRPWTLVELDFADKTSSQIVLSTHPDRRFIEVEIKVADVRAACAELRATPGVSFVVEPFDIENGHVAVMKAPDGNEFVLIGG
jgi:catechol 2,3-dioxygenase-like lactoylglutathione lyase family enzyme